mmetsp:Transcript_11746/g.47421  ORF Transcript_11746/g.47421 Transcript_11746/m.47421 type:complete len:666 (-) Transcript_11746:164-2161(-)
MGAGLDKDASNHFDKRTLRVMHANEFTRALRKEVSRRNKLAGKENGVADPEPVEATEAAPEGGDCTAIIRKRPIFEHEQEKGEFDVIQCYGPTIAIYNCQRHMNGQTLYMSRSEFKFPAVYSEKDSTEKIYEADIAPAVRDWSSGRSGCTLFMYGQTGSGKSYTINGLLELAAREAFVLAASSDVAVSVFEIAGGKCYDLLSPVEDVMDESADDESAAIAPKHKEVFLRESEEGEMCVRGLLEESCPTTADVLDAIRRANESRATQSTSANDTSSRSHAVYQLRSSQGSLLRFVDLAGSERNRDSMFHTEARQKESIEINVSLNSLKECIRLRIQQEELWRQELRAHQEKHPFSAPELSTKVTVHMPFRRSALTRVLKASLLPRVPQGMTLADDKGSERHRTILIATVSPAASDTEHSMSTLQHASLMAVGGQKARETKIAVQTESEAKAAAAKAAAKEQAKNVDNPKEWSSEEVQAWVKGIAGTPPDLRLILRKFKNVTGKELARFTRNMFEEHCCGNKVLAQKLFTSISALKRKVDQQQQLARRQQMREGSKTAAKAGSKAGARPATKSSATARSATAKSTGTKKRVATSRAGVARPSSQANVRQTAAKKTATKKVSSRVDSGIRAGSKRTAAGGSRAAHDAEKAGSGAKRIRPTSGLTAAGL